MQRNIKKFPNKKTRKKLYSKHNNLNAYIILFIVYDCLWYLFIFCFLFIFYCIIYILQ